MEKVNAVFEAAIRAEEAGDFDKARRLYEQASVLAPASPHPRVRLAVLLLETGQWSQAIRFGRQLIKRWPRIPLAYFVIGSSYARLGRLRLAERFYRQALAIEEDSNLLTIHGHVLSELRQNDEAEECLRKAVGLDPENEEAHYHLGRVYKQKGKFDTAEEHLRRAIEINPKYKFPYAELGELLAKDRPRDAISFLRKAVDFNPDDGYSRAYLALSLSRLKKLKAADEQYRKLLDIWPNKSLPYRCYGDFLASNKKDRSTAEWYLRKAVEIDPRDEWANYFLGRHLIYWDQNEEARKFLMKASRQGHSKARELIRWIDEQR